MKPISSIIKGPFGGLYEENFFFAINANQPIHLTPEEVSLKNDSFLWHQMQKNYESFIQSLKKIKTREDKPLIPRNIHIIWLGEQTHYQVNEVIHSWREKHPGWECKLWRNQDALSLLKFLDRYFPNLLPAYMAAGNYAEKSDIVRLAILYTQGGFYTDADLYCHGSLEGLIHASNFFVCMEQNNYDSLLVCNAAIGSCPKNQILKHALCSIRSKRDNEHPESFLYRTGPLMMSSRIHEALLRDWESDTTNTLILPPGYFYPLPYTQASENNNQIPIDQARSYLLPWSIGLHLWDKSW